jgi:hypothetical protein
MEKIYDLRLNCKHQRMRWGSIIELQVRFLL